MNDTIRACALYGFRCGQCDATCVLSGPMAEQNHSKGNVIPEDKCENCAPETLFTQLFKINYISFVHFQIVVFRSSKLIQVACGFNIKLNNKFRVRFIKHPGIAYPKSQLRACAIKQPHRRCKHHTKNQATSCVRLLRWRCISSRIYQFHNAIFLVHENQ